MRFASLIVLLVIATPAAVATAPAVAFARTGTVSVTGFSHALGVLGGTGELGGLGGTVSSLASAGGCGGVCQGTWVMKVGGAVFAGGTFSCRSAACTYTGSVQVQNPTAFTIESTSAGMAGHLPDRDAWIQDVQRWAAANPAAVRNLNMSADDFVGTAGRNVAIGR